MYHWRKYFKNVISKSQLIYRFNFFTLWSFLKWSSYCNRREPWHIKLKNATCFWLFPITDSIISLKHFKYRIETKDIFSVLLYLVWDFTRMIMISSQRENKILFTNNWVSIWAVDCTGMIITTSTFHLQH